MEAEVNKAAHNSEASLLIAQGYHRSLEESSPGGPAERVQGGSPPTPRRDQRRRRVHREMMCAMK